MHNVVRYVMHSVVLLQQLLRCACCAVLRNVLLANNSIVVQVHALRVIVNCKTSTVCARAARAAQCNALQYAQSSFVAL